jgi:hypothetical protein
MSESTGTPSTPAPVPSASVAAGLAYRLPPIGPRPVPVSRRWSAFSGLVATGGALATGELLAGLLPGIPSPILSVGRWVIDLQPPGAKDFVVALFGTADKLALEVLVLVVALAIGAGLGLLARSRQGSALLVLAGFVVLGLAAGLRDPSTQPTLAVLAAFAELAVGGWILDRLGRIAGTTAVRGPIGTGGPASMPDWTRRTLLIRGGALAVGSVIAGAAGRVLLERQRTPVGNSPTPVAEVPASIPAGADLDLEGLTPIVVPNEDFYRIDTALLVPNIDRDGWRLRIHGMVDREVTLSYEDLVGLEIIEQYVTIACVSNSVGGDLIGNALWAGVRLRDVLELAGVQAGATQLVGRSGDGWTAGMPTAWIMDPER